MASPTEKLKGVKILLTGGFGYIGKHLALLLLQNGAKVEIWDIKKPMNDQYFDWWKGPNLSYNVVDIYDNPQQIEYYRKHYKFDVVINLAALADVPSCEANPRRAYDVNVHGCRRMGFLAQDWDALFLQADSAMSPFFNKAPSVYIETKAAAKAFVKMLRESGAKASCLTLYNVAGAHSLGLVGEDHQPETHFIPNLVLAALSGTTFKLDSKSHMIKRDFVHVWDVAYAFYVAILRHREGVLENKDYEVGRGEEMSLYDVIREANEQRLVANIENYDSGRWEPYEHGYSMKSDPRNWLPGWFPFRKVWGMIWDQRNYAEKHLLPK